MTNQERIENIKQRIKNFDALPFCKNPEARNSANRIKNRVEKICLILEDMNLRFEQDSISALHFNELEEICYEMITQAENLQE